MIEHRRCVEIFCLMIGLCVACPGLADNVGQANRSSSWFGAPDEYEEPWKESDSILPVVPQKEDLTRLVSNRLPDDYEYVIDRNSVSLQSDLVFRYTVVIRAPTGTTNGFYEGLHCETGQYRILGILTDKSFRKPFTAEWQPIPRSGLTIHRAVLMDEFVCTGHRRPADLKTINSRLDESAKSANRKLKVWRRDFETENKS